MDITSESHNIDYPTPINGSQPFAVGFYSADPEDLGRESFNSRFFQLRNSELRRDSLVSAFISNINGTSSIMPVCRQIINEEASNRARPTNDLVEAEIERQKKYANEHIWIIMSTVIAISFIGNIAYGTVAIIFPN